MALSTKDIARLQTIIKAASSLLDELTTGEGKKTPGKGAAKKAAAGKGRTAAKKVGRPRKAPSATKRAQKK